MVSTMHDEYLKEALRRIKNNEPLGEELNRLMLDRVKRQREQNRRDYESKLHTAQIKGGALENGGVWRVDWTKCDKK